jgi:hypothetical protein
MTTHVVLESHINHHIVVVIVVNCDTTIPAHEEHFQDWWCAPTCSCQLRQLLSTFIALLQRKCFIGNYSTRSVWNGEIVTPPWWGASKAFASAKITLLPNLTTQSRYHLWCQYCQLNCSVFRGKPNCETWKQERTMWYDVKIIGKIRWNLIRILHPNIA